MKSLRYNVIEEAEFTAMQRNILYCILNEEIAILRVLVENGISRCRRGHVIGSG